MNTNFIFFLSFFGLNFFGGTYQLMVAYERKKIKEIVQRQTERLLRPKRNTEKHSATNNKTNENFVNDKQKKRVPPEELSKAFKINIEINCSDQNAYAYSNTYFLRICLRLLNMIAKQFHLSRDRKHIYMKTKT